MNRLIPRTNKLLLNLCIAIGLVFSSITPAMAQTPQAEAAAPAAPGLLTPANYSTTYASVDQPRALPTFSWTPVTGAPFYELEISVQQGFNQDQIHIIGMTNTMYKIGSMVQGDDIILPDAAPLFWHVRACTESNSGCGFWSPTWQFEKDWKRLDAINKNAPVLQQPPNGAVLAYNDALGGGSTERPSFSWKAVPGAGYYRFELSRNNLSNPDYVFPPVWTTNTSTQPIRKPADGTYYWRVTAFSRGIPQDWQGESSEWRAVTYNYTQRYIPQPVEPTNDSFPVFTPTFRWTAVRGIQRYEMQYSTKSDFSSDVNWISTPTTSFTPTNALPNDNDYYWRVRAVSGDSNAPNVWSQVFHFQKKWELKPQYLTPENGFPYMRQPTFSWTPVPGAAEYALEILDSQNNISKIYRTPNTYYTPTDDLCGMKTVKWRVRPYDSNYNPGGGKELAVWSYDCDSSNVLPGMGWTFPPMQLSPLYYYMPDPQFNPHDDRTMALPAFMWQRVLNASKVQAKAYEVEIDDDPLFMSSWTIKTENLALIPASAAQLDKSTVYYWRVRAMDGTGDQANATSPWSEAWAMRYDPALLPPATDTIQALRPLDGSEWVETTPMFEWNPLKGANKYEVQISLDTTFASLVQPGAVVDFPTYVPLTRLPLGIYYWRVRGLNGATPVGTWSGTMRFQVAAQSRWALSRTIGTSSMPVIASDPQGDMPDQNYDLTNLSITQGYDSWYFRFNANTSATDKVYVIYIDADHKVNSGGAADPRGYTVSTNAAFRPEYVIYIFQRSGALSLTNTYLYTWSGTAWSTPRAMDANSMAGNQMSYSGGVLEMSVRGSNIGQTNSGNSLAVSVFSARINGGPAIDTVPTDPSVTFTDPATAAGQVTLSRFVNVSDRLVLMGPANKAGAADTVTYRTVPPFFWQPPIETGDVCGYSINIALDPLYNNPVYTANWTYTTEYTFYGDLRGDNTYYWRVHPNYCNGGSLWSWSEAANIVRDSIGATGLTLVKSTANTMVPEFKWNRMESASRYLIQVDDNADFSSPVVQEETAALSLTPWNNYFRDGTLYYWRIQAREYGDGIAVLDDWASGTPFTVTRGVPANLTAIPPVTNYTPTFCWDPVPDAWQYLIQIAYDADFKVLYTQSETEQNCFTPEVALRDGIFYWHVAMKDGWGNYGQFSPSATYNKQYPVPNVISPTSYAGKFPVFRWSGVDGTWRYQIQVAKDANFSAGQVFIDINVANNEYSPLQPIDAKEYYWRVRMIDRHDNPGPFTPTIHIGGIKGQPFFLPLTMRDAGN